MKNSKKDLIIAGVAVLSMIVIFVVVLQHQKPGRIGLKDHLDDVVLEVDGQAYRLRDMVFYIAYEEQMVEEQASIYSPEDTNSYWNLHTNGEFIKISARDAAMKMAVHDMIFYRIAEANALTLDAQGQGVLEERQEDFWSNLSGYQQEVLMGVKEDLYRGMERMALAQQQQDLYAASHGCGYDDYNIDGPDYEGLLQEHTYKVQTDIWERLDFGNITLSHKK